ncbi:MAG: hypothetical protein GF308_14545 [Candidatus Heimdallarchaeota archaeon]|nr:hypothetical protein [Candidatus Heimdallarchaeota archaeon]
MTYKWCNNCEMLSQLNFQPTEEHWAFICENCGQEIPLLRLIACPICSFEFKVPYILAYDSLALPKECPLCKKAIERDKWIIQESNLHFLLENDVKKEIKK